MSLVEAKGALRRASADRRRRAKAAAGEGAGERVAELFLANVPLAAGAAVSGYWPIGDELDARPLLARLHELGHACALPTVAARGQPLVFRQWSPGVPLVAASFGLSEPAAEAPTVIPDVLGVPLLAFDARGYRLGYGGGYYDRTIAALRRSGREIAAVGLAFAAQEVEAVPHGPGDERLDWVVTERAARRLT